MTSSTHPASLHTLVLLQRSNKPSTRSYLECPSVHHAAQEIITMFETKLKNEQKLQTLTYTDLDVVSFIDSFHEFACLVREQIVPGKFAYVPKDTSWIKPHIRPALQRKLQEMSSSASMPDLTPSAVSTLASRLSSPASSLNSKRGDIKRKDPTHSDTNRGSKATGSSGILVAANSKITKRSGPVSRSINTKSAQLFTAAYAERMKLSHVQPLGSPNSSLGVQDSNKRRRK